MDSTADVSSQSDRRGKLRRRVLLSGKLAYLDERITADCSIRNLSDGGAMIVGPEIHLPNELFLIVIKQASLHEARTAWRDGNRCGLEFTKSWRLSDDAPASMLQLWRALLPR
ncbi:MAG TPA: PilZ domain-containing protein [Caulobacteraceae bacterium]|nr:PilZ domain-containing protein [Caulobacteraceae bacterium]